MSATRDVIDMYEETILPNGVRVIVEEAPAARSVSLGVWIGAGSRYEIPDIHGVSHFVEHMLFKGTERRSGKDLAAAIEGRGGQLNAFTAKEYTCVHAKALDEDVDIALDVLSDMLLDSRFDPGDVEREKGIVLEEIGLSEDTPDDLIQELAVRAAWPQHPLGRDILGTCDSVRSLTRDMVLNYYRENYTGGNMAVVAAGNCRPGQIFDAVGRRFSALPSGSRRRSDHAPGITPGRVVQKKDTEQSHICVVGPGPGANSSEFYAFCLLAEILGGGSTSRLFQQIREERGLAYSVYTYESSFRDCGLITTYAGANPMRAGEALEAILGEFQSVLARGLSPGEVSSAKREARGALILSLENTSSRMMSLGKSEMVMGRPVSSEEVLEMIESVTLEDVMNVATESLNDSNLAVAAISPVDLDAAKGEEPDGQT